MFLVIEWIDGSGKTTQVSLLKDMLEQVGKTVKVFDFPRYEEPSSFFVKKFLNGDYKKDISSELISLFFALDRFDASQQLKNDIKIYDYVISNRYVSSNMIHQTAKICQRDCILPSSEKVRTFLDWIFHIEYTICEIPKPHMTIFLDVPPSVSYWLIEKKSQRQYIKEGNKDINEKDFIHQKKAYESALFLTSIFWWEVIECTKNWQILSPENITKNILSKIV
jgi:dTMP kinase